MQHLNPIAVQTQIVCIVPQHLNSIYAESMQCLMYSHIMYFEYTFWPAAFEQHFSSIDAA